MSTQRPGDTGMGSHHPVDKPVLRARALRPFRVEGWSTKEQRWVRITTIKDEAEALRIVDNIAIHSTTYTKARVFDLRTREIVIAWPVNVSS